ncbi:MAG TPA: MHYT domain-containing protein [Alphaproteobacteria bacterium]|nr:MHYT domain-containing protein [Alphaproteobacteria bacterium]
MLAKIFHPHDPSLVVVSVALAVLAAYVSLELAGRIRAATGWARAVWLLAGAVSMGGGIWSMHFVAMLAVVLPVPVAYDLPVTALSLLIAILGAACGLYVVLWHELSLPRLLLGGGAIGSAIAAMHYTGMAALRMPALSTYEPSLVALSVAIAIAAATLALWLTFVLERVILKICGAVLMGAAIAGMHYTGMAGFICTPVESASFSLAGLSPSGLAAWVIAASSVILLNGLVLAYYDRRLKRLAWEAAMAMRLSRSQEHLARAQEVSRTGSIERDLRTGTVEWSDQTYSIFGMARNSPVPGREEFLALFHPDDGAILAAVMDLSNEGMPADAVELRIPRPDGTVTLVHYESAVFFDDDGAPIRWIGTCTDVTERKRAEEALRDTQAELARAARLTTMGELAASIAHEINQPLAAIVTSGGACLRWLARRPPAIDEANEAVNAIVYDGTRASEVIKRVRALFRRAAPERVPLDINKTVRDVLALVRGELERRRVTVRTELSPCLPPVMGDRIELQQVMLNLIMNALEAMTAVGNRPRELRIRSQRDNSDGVLVAVEDSGTGLDFDNVERIFDAFFTTKSSGTGMGLSISRSIIEAHGGRLWASPASPHGAVFQFTLSAAAEAVS